VNGTNRVDYETGEIIPPYNTYYDNYTWPTPTAMAGKNSDQNETISGADIAAALDYFPRGDQPYQANAGWNDTLEFDEYPLEIQCSHCWINGFKMDYSSQWGGRWE
jgi:hypothetical protein